MTAVSGGVKGLVARAQREAQRRGQTPSTAHLLLVMLQAGGPAGALLSRLGIREGDLLSAISVVDAEPASALERAMERAYRVAKATNAQEVLPSHLLFAIARDGRSTAHRSLEKLGTGPARVQQALVEALGWNDPALSPVSSHSVPRPTPKPSRPTRKPNRRRNTTRPSARAVVAPQPEAPEIDPMPEAPSPEPSQPEVALPVPAIDPKLFPLLSSIGRNLTAFAKDGGIDPVIGRDDEIEQLLDVLARRRSNNPILVGPPGVGKTAIVEGLALRLAQGGKGVHGLDELMIIEISAGGLVSGTGIRGALSDRIRQLKTEVDQARGRLILFIDEIHALFTGGDAPDDLGHELKASLARGELPCIGATTTSEYRKYVERDLALARRFSAIHVAEPTAKDAVEILRGIAPRYEVHHAVAYERDSIDAAVEFSVRYLPNQTLPDKAIALIDLAAARVRRRGGAVVDVEAIATVIAEQARVPVDRLLQQDTDKMLDLERHLAETVVGHEDSIKRVADALRKGAAGFHGQRPLATFLFVGPTGVGKTETARALNEVFFPGSAMSRFDMSELSEAHAVARLFGAPPGYVGYDAGGQLTEAIRHRPYQLILLDEIEKAHMDVLQTLLPLLDEGRLTDGKGRTVDGTHTIIIMTSNLGAERAQAGGSRIGFGDGADATGRDASSALNGARRALPPELWNRIDEPLYFGTLSKSDVSEIARRMMSGVAAQLKDAHGIALRWDESAIAALLSAGGYDAALGARPMKRTIGRLVEAPLAEALLAGRFGRGDCLELRGDGVEVSFALSDPAEAAE